MYRHLNEIPLIPLIVTFILGVWGGILNILKKIKLRKETNKNLTLFEIIYFFFLDVTTSSIFSILTFIGLTGYGVNETIAVAISGIVAYNGTKAILILNLYFAEKLNITIWKEALKNEINNNKTTERKQND